MWMEIMKWNGSKEKGRIHTHTRTHVRGSEPCTRLHDCTSMTSLLSAMFGGWSQDNWWLFLTLRFLRALALCMYVWVNFMFVILLDNGKQKKINHHYDVWGRSSFCMHVCVSIRVCSCVCSCMRIHNLRFSWVDAELYVFRLLLKLLLLLLPYFGIDSKNKFSISSPRKYQVFWTIFRRNMRYHSNLSIYLS